MTQPMTLQEQSPETKPPVKPLWLDQRRIIWQSDFDNGPLYLEDPRILTPDEIDDLESHFALILRSYRRRAEAINAIAKEQPNES